MSADEPTCGEEIATDAEVPAGLARLFFHVVENVEAHARWAASGPDGQREHDGLMAVAGEVRAMAAAAERAAEAMRAMRDVPATAHDPRRFDRAAFLRWMHAKIDLQLEVAALLQRHAELSKQALAAMRGEAASNDRPR